MVIRTHILEQLLLLVLFHIPRNDLQRFDSPNYYQSIENSTLPFDSHMRCVCEGECERIQEQDCVWGLTLDFCGCCLLCSRGDGEPCGGALGTCARGLKCSRHIGREEASCSQTVQVESCVNPSSQFGCSYHGGNCHCENHTMCPDTEMFLFDTEQACRSRIAFLNARNDDKSVLTSKSHRTEG
ncbi:unnamed protein product [Allacma fusca]|uniref:IGFBP N-terminal domain-containing protein n=1 Tax=Allacma fusca TaxID=39272 RepID=A0A8J2J3J1_9HEXA|nr:unnamed protein product [Allacma fusca]